MAEQFDRASWEKRVEELRQKLINDEAAQTFAEAYNVPGDNQRLRRIRRNRWLLRHLPKH